MDATFAAGGTTDAGAAAAVAPPLRSAPVLATPPRQYSRLAVLGIWAAAALPMGALAWLVAPALAGPQPSAGRFAVMLILAITIGLVWQAVLVALLVVREQRTLRWRAIREALWLVRPTDRVGRRRASLLWWCVPGILAFGALQLTSFGLHGPANHDFGPFLQSDAGHRLLHGNWGLFALIVTMFVFNTVLGEELLFRGLLLPRMRGSFGRLDWVANGVLMGVYHLHQPWSIPASIVAGLIFAYLTKRFRSAWMGIIVHSTQSIVLGAMVLPLVLGVV